MTAHARLGTTTPTLGEQVAELRAMVIDQRARIEALEAASDDAVVDGRPRAGKWLKMKRHRANLGFRGGISRSCAGRVGRATTMTGRIDWSTLAVCLFAKFAQFVLEPAGRRGLFLIDWRSLWNFREKITLLVSLRA